MHNARPSSFFIILTRTRTQNLPHTAPRDQGGGAAQGGGGYGGDGGGDAAQGEGGWRFWGGAEASSNGNCSDRAAVANDMAVVANYSALGSENEVRRAGKARERERKGERGRGGEERERKGETGSEAGDRVKENGRWDLCGICSKFVT